MKILKELKLSQLSKAELNIKQQNVLRGGVGTCACICIGNVCSCACAYYGEQEGPDDSYYGGSSTADNGNANSYSKGGDTTDQNASSTHG